MLPNYTVLLTFFDIFGYNSGLSILTRHKKIIQSIHILIATTLTTLQLYLSFGLYSPLRAIIKLNNLFQCSIALIAYYCIIIDSIFYRRHHKRFWIILKRINENLCDQNYFKNRSYILKFLEYFLVTFLLNFLRFKYIIFKFFGAMVIFAYVFLMSQIRIFYYLFCLDNINHHLNIIENKLKGAPIENRKLSLSPLNVQSSSNHSYEIELLQWIRSYYQCIHEMTNHLNEIFGLSNLSIISLCFFYFLTYSNYYYMYSSQHPVLKSVRK